jgi:glycosyltransferase involved in cell wall biosynthesis
MQKVSVPSVSVIIPCYNAAAYIGDTIQAVLDQSYFDFEIIVVNDGSIDNSRDVINKFVSDKIILIDKANGGVSSARNEGLKRARGKYIALLDADDIWLKDNLKYKIEKLESDNDLLFVYSDMIEFFENGDSQTVYGFMSPDFSGAYLKQQTLPVPGVCSNIIFRANIILQKQLFFDENLSTAADQDFMIFLSTYGKGAYISQPLWKYRVLSSSMSRKIVSIEKDQLYFMNKYSGLKLYRNKAFKRMCFSKNYLILAGCFWNDANNKPKALKYLMKAIANDMSLIFKLGGKMITKK